MIVVIESPYAANKVTGVSVADHERYLDRCILDCVRRGEVPYASHKMLTRRRCLDDLKHHERVEGMANGFAFRAQLVCSNVPSMTVVYTDYGTSGGMTAGIEAAAHLRHHVEYRSIGVNT